MNRRNLLKTIALAPLIIPFAKLKILKPIPIAEAPIISAPVEGAFVQAARAEMATGYAAMMAELKELYQGPITDLICDQM